MKTTMQRVDDPIRPADAGGSSHRIRKAMWKILLRGEFTAVVGTIIVFVFFALDAGSSGFLSFTGTRNYLEVAANVGIVACPVCLLLVAGEFDLSVGAMVGAGGMLFSYPVVHLGWPLWEALLFAMAIAACVGATNGLLVVKTGIPSFLVTLAMMFFLLGSTLAITQILTGTSSISGETEAVRGDALLRIFTGHVAGISASIIWWLVLTAIAAYVLDRLPAGNWIYASGGNADAAFKAGVPVHKIKILLYVCTAMAATLIAILSTLAINTAEITQGTGKEFQAATAAVIGGALVTGGAGSPIGTAIGALLFGMVSQGFFFTSIDNSWFQAFLGVMLLLAVGINHYTRSLAARRRV